MANKLSDVLLMIQNTQIRIALEKMMGLCGVTSTSKTGDAIVTDLTGNVTGNLTGNVSGSILGPSGAFTALTTVSITKTADGAISPTDSFIKLDGTDNTCDMTISAPYSGSYKVITCVDATNSVTVTLTAGTFDGTNEIATFDAAEETLVLFGISATRFVILENIGSVALSTAA